MHAATEPVVQVVDDQPDSVLDTDSFDLTAAAGPRTWAHNCRIDGTDVCVATIYNNYDFVAGLSGRGTTNFFDEYHSISQLRVVSDIG